MFQDLDLLSVFINAAADGLVDYTKIQESFGASIGKSKQMILIVSIKFESSKERNMSVSNQFT